MTAASTWEGRLEAARTGPRAAGIALALEAAGIEDVRVRELAADVLRAFEALPEVLSDLPRHPDRAIAVVGRWPHPMLVAAVADLARRGPTSARGPALLALASLDVPGREALLVDAVREDDAGIRAHAAGALGLLGTPAAVAALRAAFTAETDAMAKVLIVDALERHGGV